MIFTTHLMKGMKSEVHYSFVTIFKLKQNGISGNLLELLADFLKDTKQKIVFNGQVSNWADGNARVSHEYILGPLFSMIYVNDLATVLSSSTKLFADEKSLFSVTHDINASANELNNNLAKISN